MRGAWVKLGVHVDLIDSLHPNMRENDDHTVLRARLLVDTSASALCEMGDLVLLLEASLISAEDITADLTEFYRGEKAGRYHFISRSRFSNRPTPQSKIQRSLNICSGAAETSS